MVSPAEEKPKEEQPVQPGTPTQPEASGKQGDSVQPSTPVKPAEEKTKEKTPKVSDKQEKPVQPENSGKEGTSVLPAEEKPKEEQPVQPGTPTQPEASGKQGDSVQPSTPVKPAEEKTKEKTPKVSDKQEKPVQPENSGKEGTSVSPAEEKPKEEQPVQPGTPTQPETSGKQGDSAQPSTPRNPAEEKQKEETPKVSEKEEQPVHPGTPVQPEVSGQPSTPVKSEAKEEQPVQPGTPVQPEVSGQPSTPVKAVEEKPKEEKPSVPGKQEKPVQPEASGKQGDSTQSSTPVKPESSRNEGTSITSSGGKEETSYVSDNNPVLTRKTKTLFLESLDKKVSLELYDVSIDDIEFRAVEIEDEKEINAVKDKLQGNKNVRIYDLSLHKGGKEISLNNNRLVRVALAEYENKNIEVYHVEKNGNLKQIPSVKNNGNVEFYIDHFSQFAIVSDKNNLSKTDAKNAISKENSLKQQSLPKTGMSNTNDFSLLAIISLLVLVLSRKQKDSMK